MIFFDLQKISFFPVIFRKKRYNKLIYQKGHNVAMKIYFQFMYILLFSIIGETLSTVLKLPVPGSIIGMVLLFFALKFRLIRLRQIYDAGQFMIENMTILFLPAGVGIMSHWDAISKYWWQIIVIVLLAIVVNIAVIGFVTQFVKHRFEGDYRK